MLGRLDVEESEEDEEVLDLTQLAGDEDEDSGITSGGDTGQWIDAVSRVPE